MVMTLYFGLLWCCYFTFVFNGDGTLLLFVKVLNVTCIIKVRALYYISSHCVYELLGAPAHPSKKQKHEQKEKLQIEWRAEREFCY